MDMSITVVVNQEAGTFTWRVDGMDGISAMGLIVDVLCDMQSQYLEDPMRPSLPNEGRICLEMVDDKLAMAYRPETAQPSEIQGMLVASLIGFLKKKREPGFNPYEALLGALVLAKRDE